MLADKRSAGVTPEVNLRNPLYPGEIHIGFETRGRRHLKCRTGVSYSSPTKRTDILQQLKKEKRLILCNIATLSL